MHATRTAARAALLLAVLGAVPARAQRAAPSERAERTNHAASARFWVAGAAATAAGTLLDERLRAAAAAHQTRALARAGDVVDPLGRAGDLIPALAVAVVAPRLAGRRDASDAALRVAAGYFAADAVESILKGAVGRHRPDSTGRPWRFHPFDTRHDAWHSFPSAHTTHAFAIAAALSAEAHRPWVSAAGYAAASLVGAQRVYRQAHWASDVAASAALAVATSSATDAWVARRGLGPLLRPAGASLVLGAGTLGVRLAR